MKSKEQLTLFLFLCLNFIGGRKVIKQNKTKQKKSKENKLKKDKKIKRRTNYV